MTSETSFWFDFKELLGLVPKKACPFCRSMHGIFETSIDEKGTYISKMRCKYGMVEISYRLVEKWSWHP